MSKINSVSSNEIGGHIGDMISVENSLAFKKLFKLFGSDNLEFREKKFYLDSSDKINYLFNSSINGIDTSDLILLVGTNPRYEATMLNTRIRKAFLKGTPVFSFGNPGDLTYDYKILGNKTDDLKNMLTKESEFSQKFLSSKNH